MISCFAGPPCVWPHFRASLIAVSDASVPELQKSFEVTNAFKDSYANSKKADDGVRQELPNDDTLTRSTNGVAGPNTALNDLGGKQKEIEQSAIALDDDAL